MKKHHTGFSLVEVLFIFVILAVIGFGGYYVYNKNKTPVTKSATNKASLDKTAAASKVSKSNLLSLDNGKVTFELPEGWIVTKGEDLCDRVVTADLTCIEGASVMPDVELPTRYGNGTEFFGIAVSAYQNPKQSDAKTWLQTDMQKGIGSGEVKTSSTPVNNYDSFYMWQQYDGDGATIRDIDYSYSVSNKAVTIYARTYEPGTQADGKVVGDFRQFEPAIANIANSVKIKY